MREVVTEVVMVFLFVLHVAYSMVFLAFLTNTPNPFLVAYFCWSLLVVVVLLFNTPQIRER